MLDNIVFILLIASNLSWIAYLLWRLKDINNNPAKYDLIRGFDKYLSSEWYWQPKKPFKKTDPPQTCRPRFLILFLVLPFWHFATMEVFHVLVVPSGTEAFAINERWPVLIFILLSITFGLVMSYYLTLNSKRPEDICVSIFEVCKGKRRHVAWKQLTVLLLIMSIAMFPLRMWTMYNYGYIDGDTVVCKGVLSKSDRIFELDKCSYEIVLTDSHNEVNKLLITNANGEVLSLRNSDLEHLVKVSDIIKSQIDNVQK